jgi:hypothetical protein
LKRFVSTLEGQIDKQRYNGIVKELGVDKVLSKERGFSKDREPSLEKKQVRSVSQQPTKESRSMLVTEKRTQMYPIKKEREQPTEKMTALSYLE